MKVPPDGYDVIPVDTSPLHRRKIGIIGFGNQAQPWALNFFDSGLEVYAGLRTGSASALSAIMDFIEVLSPDRIAKLCDIICMLIPDEFIPVVLREEVFPVAKKGSTIVFAHSYALFAEEIEFPETVDIILLAPHGPGEAVRKSCKGEGSIPAQWDIIQDYTGGAEKTLYGLASALGFANGGLHRINYKQEAIIDLFSEQAVLVGGLLALIREALTTLKDAGYDPAASLVSCLNEIKGTASLFTDEGLTGGLEKVSSTAAYGACKTFEKLRDPLRKAFKELLAEIESGEFTSAFKAESAADNTAIKKMMDDLKSLTGG
jgi:ketol-acid reductoisomerase